MHHCLRPSSGVKARGNFARLPWCVVGLVMVGRPRSEPQPFASNPTAASGLGQPAATGRLSGFSKVNFVVQFLAERAPAPKPATPSGNGAGVAAASPPPTQQPAARAPADPELEDEPPKSNRKLPQHLNATGPQLTIRPRCCTAVQAA